MKRSDIEHGHGGSAAPPTGFRDRAPLCFPAREAAGPPDSRASVPVRRRGFTLIEILAAMTILMVIVFILGDIFTQSTNIWKLGTKRTASLTYGRAVMDLMVREFNQSFADNVVTFKLVSQGHLYGVSSYGWDSDEVFFVSAVRTPGYDGSDGARETTRRVGHHIVYFVAPMVNETNQPIANRYRLVRCRKTGSTASTSSNLLQSAYFDKEWWRRFTPWVTYVQGKQEMEELADNIGAFEVWAYSEDADTYVYNYDSRQNGGKMPLWVDLYLETFSEEESIQMAALWAADQSAATAYRDKHARRYAARVYFPNRLGYTK